MSRIPQETTKIGMNLIVGQVTSTVLLGAGALLLVRLMPPEDYGLYSMVLPLLNLLQIARDWGVPYSVQQRISRTERSRQIQTARSVAWISLLWELSIGIMLSISLLILIPILANAMGHEAITPLLLGIVPIIAFWGIHNVIYSILISLYRSSDASQLLIVGSSTRVLFSISLVIAGYGPVGAIAGYAIASIVGSGFALILVMRSLKQPPDRDLLLSTSRREQLRDLLKLALPLGAVSFTANMLGSITPLIAAANVTPTDFAYYGAATVIYGLFLIPFQPLILTLLTSYSSVLEMDANSLGSAYSKTTTVTAALTGGVSVLGMVISNQLILLFYGPSFTNSVLLLRLLLTSFILFAPFGSVAVGPLLMSSGLIKEFTAVNIGASVIMLILATYIIPTIGVAGIIYVGILSILLTTICFNLITTRKLGISAFTKENVSMSLALLLSLALGFVLNWLLLSIPWPLNWVVPFIVAAVSMPVLIVRFGAFSLTDAEYLLEASRDNFLAKVMATVVFRITEVLTGPSSSAHTE